ncbi:MAG: hypothetical protein KA712_07420 [Myxococcales bacterium]|nr:hypothetical protein [Myxococcales bacterium]
MRRRLAGPRAAGALRVRAVKGGIVLVGVAGGALLAFALPATLRIPKAKPHPPGTPQPSALFSHRGHNQFQCYVCHPSLFPQMPLAFTHEDMNQGRACGACHDGKAAQAVTSLKCEACHVPE